MEEILNDLRRGGPSEPAEPPERPEEEGSIHERLLSRFTGLEYLRLLYFQ
jgi:hypothetical protein